MSAHRNNTGEKHPPNKYPENITDNIIVTFLYITELSKTEANKFALSAHSTGLKIQLGLIKTRKFSNNG